MFDLVSNKEIQDLKNKLFEIRQENKRINEELKNTKLELGEWKSKVVLLESENKTLRKKLEKEEKKNDNT